MMDPQELRSTVASARNGDPEACAALLEAYGRRLYGYFLRAVGNVHDAEDMLAEMMLKLLQQLRRYDERGRFEPWLFRMAANMVRDRFRRIRAAPRESHFVLHDDSHGLASVLPSTNDPPVDAVLLARERHQVLQEALDKLDATTRQMVLLRHFGQLSFKELAELFDCPLGTALAKVHRGLRRLRKLLEHDDANR